ncbi:MAG TPA: UBP-type zinc finger domain-containing protein [Aggregatilineales bacterium]|nr:UBP-type zinc finger domain-containing protein [Aggregatilineales bacterium]
MSDKCSHLHMAQEDLPENVPGCEECMARGTGWVHLRQCLICGHVGCCETSVHKHASKHYEETGHPLVRAYRPDEGWIWCYEDEALILAPRKKES